MARHAVQMVQHVMQQQTGVQGLAKFVQRERCHIELILQIQMPPLMPMNVVMGMLRMRPMVRLLFVAIQIKHLITTIICLLMMIVVIAPKYIMQGDMSHPVVVAREEVLLCPSTILILTEFPAVLVAQLAQQKLIGILT